MRYLGKIYDLLDETSKKDPSGLIEMRLKYAKVIIFFIYFIFFFFLCKKLNFFFFFSVNN